MRAIVNFALIFCVVFISLVLYIKYPDYWSRPILEQNLLLTLTHKNGIKTSAKTTALFGLMTAFTVILASSSLYIPIGGALLCRFAALFIAAATTISPKGGIFTLAASVIILISILPSYAPILVLVDGPLGLSLGWSILRKKSFGITLALTAGSMALGIILISYVLNIPAFPGLTTRFLPHLNFLLIICYSIAYSWAWITIAAEFFWLIYLKLK